MHEKGGKTTIKFQHRKNFTMEKLSYLMEIANSLRKNDVIAELTYLKKGLNSEMAELILPIVGEFSSGKTTFINELTEGGKLETASKSTTSTVYEIYFNNDKEKAEIIFENDEVKLVNDISTIKNDDLVDVKRIKIYDTSKKIADKTILVDTPGLSSNNPKHIEALSSYLPNADAIFLFSDVNQQITSSLLDFINTNNLVHLPLYLVLTKTDTKTKEEIDNIKQYIVENIGLDIDNIIGISSKNSDIGEFFKLMDEIQANKKNIINTALAYRVDKIADYLKTYIEELIENTVSDTNFQEEIKKGRKKLDRTLDFINNLIDDIRNELDDVEYEVIKQFETHVYSKLDSLIVRNSANIDNEAAGLINSVANLVFANYQKEIERKLYMTISNRRNSELVPLRSIEGVDFSGVSIGQLSYGMNLSAAGQSKVKNITTCIKIAAVIAAVVVTAGAATPAAAGTTAAGTTAASAAPGVVGAAAGSGAASAATASLGSAKIASIAGTTISAVDTVTDLASINSNRNLKKKLFEHAQNKDVYREGFNKHLKTYDDYNLQVGQIINPNQKQGFMEGIVSSTTDGVIGKPERKRMINNFLRDSLNPEFKSKLSIISGSLLNDIQNSLNHEATVTINQIEEHLVELEEMNKNEKEDFDTYMKSLKQYLKQLS